MAACRAAGDHLRIAMPHGTRAQIDRFVADLAREKQGGGEASPREPLIRPSGNT